MPRDRQRGNTMLLALIVMSALATLGSLTVVSVQSTLKASTNDRAQSVALYAAESGAAYAMDVLRNNYNVVAGQYWTPILLACGAGTPGWPLPLSASTNPPLAQSGALPGTANNPFSIDQNAWFSVTIINNHDGTGDSSDSDSDVIIRSTGFGPGGSTTIVEWEVRWPGATDPPPSPPPPSPPPSPPWPWPTSTADAATQGRTIGLVLVGWHVVNL
jgi:Tfp pilus assembly protein PilX